jgi:hypothetical protein
MAKSIFDDLPDTPLKEERQEKSIKRSKHREALTPGEAVEGKRRLYSMVEKAFDALEEAIQTADHATAIKAAQILLDRAGFGPKSTVDLNSTHMDLSNLTKEELADRASRISAQLRAKAGLLPESTPPSKPSKPVTVN